MTIDTNFSATLYPDPDYHLSVNASQTGDLALTYHERRNGAAPEVSRVSFGSLAEMEAVAKAMLTVVEMARKE